MGILLVTGAVTPAPDEQAPQRRAIGRHRAEQPDHFGFGDGRDRQRPLELFSEPRHRVERRRDRALVGADEARGLEPADFLGEGAHRDASTFRERSDADRFVADREEQPRALWASQRPQHPDRSTDRPRGSFGPPPILAPRRREG